MAWFGKKKSDDADVRRQAARNLNAREIAELEAKIKEYESEKSAAHGDLDRVSDELVKLEKALVGKKREYDQATGARKGIVKKEFMLLDRNFRLKQGEPELIQKKLEQYDTLIASAQEAIEMLRGASVMDDARSIGEKHEEGFASMQEDAAAVGALASGLIVPSQDEDYDVAARFAELMGESHGSAPESEREKVEPGTAREESRATRLDDLEI